MQSKKSKIIIFIVIIFIIATSVFGIKNQIKIKEANIKNERGTFKVKGDKLQLTDENKYKFTITLSHDKKSLKFAGFTFK